MRELELLNKLISEDGASRRQNRYLASELVDPPFSLLPEQWQDWCATWAFHASPMREKRPEQRQKLRKLTLRCAAQDDAVAAIDKPCLARVDFISIHLSSPHWMFALGVVPATAGAFFYALPRSRASASSIWSSSAKMSPTAL